MPGTIQVSVMELMDSTGNASFSDARASKSSPLSLKVAMGKREYLTSGKEDFSFPVTSLRENLRMMMYDGEGNMISQTEIKVISVVEKRLWDDLFPLEGGGTVHLRMQLILSEEEQLKIQEMRLSALKRKHKDLLKGGWIDDFVKEKTGDPNLHTAEHEMEEERNGQLNLRDQDNDGGPSTSSTLQDSAEGMKPLMDEEAISKPGLDEEKNMIELASEGAQEIDSYVKNDMDNQILYSESPTTRRYTEESSSVSIVLEDQLNSTKKKKINETSSASSVRKMISAFEYSKPQLQGDHSGSSVSVASKIGAASSLKRTSSEESELKKLFHRTLAKSFSAEQLSNSNLEDNSKMSKPFRQNKHEGHQFDRIVTKRASIQKDNSPGADKSKDGQESETENSYLNSLNTSKSQASTNTNKFQKSFVPESVTSSGGSTENVITSELAPAINLNKDNTMEKSIKPDVHQEGLDQFEGSSAIVKEDKSFASEEVNQSPTVDATAAVKTSEHLLSVSSADEVKVLRSGENPILKTNSKVYQPKKGNLTRDQDVKDCVQEYQKVITSVSKVERKNVEHDFEKNDPLSINMANDSLKRTDAYIRRPVKQISILNRASKDLTFTCYRCHLMKELSTYVSSYHPLEVLSIQREDDLFGKLGIVVPRYFCLTTGSKQIRTLLHSCSSCLGSLREEELSEKKMLLDSSATKIKNLNPKAPFGMSNILGRLIDQGARIIVIVVACGTLVLNVK